MADQATHTQRARVRYEAAETLVSDVFRRSGVDGVLGDVSCMIAHALESSCNENQVQIAAQLLWVLCHSLISFRLTAAIQFVQVFVALEQRAAKIDIFPHVTRLRCP